MSAKIPWPDDNPAAWNRCELGGLDMPGLALVKVRLSEELDIKKPKGAHGATITRQGYNPAKVTILLRMWEAEQFEAFQDVVVPLRPKVGGGRSAEPLSIVHPRAALWGIQAVSILSIDDSGDRGDRYDVTFECVEHFPPPKNVVATKTDSRAAPPRDNVLRAEPQNMPKPSAAGAGP
jgi:hypothetical protein